LNHCRLVVIDHPNIIGIRIYDKLIPRSCVAKLIFMDGLPGLGVDIIKAIKAANGYQNF
jgi:hypothetical protein